MPMPRCATSMLVLHAMLLAGCAATSTAPPPVALHTDRPTSVTLHSGGDYSLVRTFVDGRDAGWFLLDTGSNVTAVERGVARRLELPVIGEGRAQGVAGSQALEYTRFQSVSIAGFQLRPRGLASLNMAHMRSGGASWSGILGFDALTGEVFSLDQRAGVLTIGDTFNDELHVERLIPWSGLPVVEVKIAGRPVRLLLDTGANKELSLHLDVVQRYPDMLSVPHSGAGRSRGVGGSVAGALTWVKNLELLGVTLRDVPVSVDPRPPGLNDPRIAGRVGNGLLKHYRLTFDVANARMAAEWLPQ